VQPAPERFVGRDRPAREQHDRLEHDRDLVALQQLPQLPRPLDEAVRQVGTLDGDRGRVPERAALGLRLAQVGAPDAELEVREVDD
jgi:hypothetical protein